MVMYAGYDIDIREAESAPLSGWTAARFLIGPLADLGEYRERKQANDQAGNHIEEIRNLLTQLKASAVGKCVMDHWADITPAVKRARRMTITPVSYDSAQQERGYCNVATYRGNTVTIEYSAKLWRNGGACFHLLGNVGFELDKIMLHEMVHAARIGTDRARTDGGSDAGPSYIKNPHAPNAPDFEKAEDFLAITVPNIYASSLGETRLRGGHGKNRVNADNALAPEYSTSQGFLSDPYQLGAVWYFLFDEPEPIAQALSKVPGLAFNPFQYLADHKEEAAYRRDRAAVSIPPKPKT